MRPLHEALRAFCVPHVSYSPSGMKWKFVVAAFSHNCWISYLCATPNFGKIGAQAATPPSLYPQKNYLHETIIIKLIEQRPTLFSGYILLLVDDALITIDPF